MDICINKAGASSSFRFQRHLAWPVAVERATKTPRLYADTLIHSSKELEMNEIGKHIPVASIDALSLTAIFENGQIF